MHSRNIAPGSKVIQLNFIYTCIYLYIMKIL